MMRSPSGTEFCVEPLRFVGFPSDDARTSYYVWLMAEFKSSKKGDLTARNLVLLHTEKLSQWLCAELTRQITGIAEAAAMTYYQTEEPTRQT